MTAPDLDPRQIGREAAAKMVEEYDPEQARAYRAAEAESSRFLAYAIAGATEMLARLGGAEATSATIIGEELPPAFRDTEVARGNSARILGAVFSKPPAAPAPGGVWVSREALDWLFGSGPDADGKWFGDESIPKRGAYWWRAHFRKLIGEAGPVYDKSTRSLAAAPSQPAGETTEHTIDGAQVGVVYATPSPDAIRREAFAIDFMQLFSDIDVFDWERIDDIFAVSSDRRASYFRRKFADLRKCADALAAPAREG